MKDLNRRVLRDEREARYTTIAEEAQTRGISRVAAFHGVSEKYVIRAIYDHRDSVEIMRAAKDVENKSKFYKVGFYY